MDFKRRLEYIRDAFLGGVYSLLVAIEFVTTSLRSLFTSTSTLSTEELEMPDLLEMP